MNAGEDAAEESPAGVESAACRSVWTERRSASTSGSMSGSAPASPSASGSATASRRPARRSRRRPRRRNPRAHRCSRATRVRRSAKNLRAVLSTQIIIDHICGIVFRTLVHSREVRIMIGIYIIIYKIYL